MEPFLAKAAAMEERRRHPRFRIKHLNVIATGSDSESIALVRDAGPGGFQLQYLSGTDQRDRWRRINVVAGEGWHQFLMAEVSCRIAYDLKSLMEEGSFSGLDVRLCGLAFTELTQAQHLVLDMLLNRWAAEETAGLP